MTEHSELAQWLRQQIGPTQRFKTARHLSLAAGLSQNMVDIILRRGRAGPKTLMRLADVMGVPAKALFVKAGWLKENNAVSVFNRDLSEGEEEILMAYRELPVEGRAWLLAALNGMRQRARDAIRED